MFEREVGKATRKVIESNELAEIDPGKILSVSEQIANWVVGKFVVHFVVLVIEEFAEESAGYSDEQTDGHFPGEVGEKALWRDVGQVVDMIAVVDY